MASPAPQKQRQELGVSAPDPLPFQNNGRRPAVSHFYRPFLAQTYELQGFCALLIPFRGAFDLKARLQFCLVFLRIRKSFSYDRLIQDHVPITAWSPGCKFQTNLRARCAALGQSGRITNQAQVCFTQSRDNAALNHAAVGILPDVAPAELLLNYRAHSLRRPIRIIALNPEEAVEGDLIGRVPIEAVDLLFDTTAAENETGFSLKNMTSRTHRMRRTSNRFGSPNGSLIMSCGDPTEPQGRWVS